LGQLHRLLLEQVDDAGLGTVMLRPFDVKLSDVDIVEPDIVVVLREHLRRLEPKYLDGPPDLAVEILSPGTARRDRGTKMERYRLFSIPEYWIVDAEARVLEQFVLADRDYRLSGRREISVAMHVADVRLDLGRVW
ncbi:MAG TPA: Uma2 family endonuclease, partial [Planctomycetota bacterium]|nr:Uma2 family endonuclease [Planctomycetota bacterium]